MSEEVQQEKPKSYWKKAWKRKTIVKTIKYKIDDWLKSIKDEELMKLIQKDYILTGGAISSMLGGDHPNDYDIYFRTKSTAKLVAEYYLKQALKKEEQKNQNDRISSIEVRENDKGVEIFIKSAGLISNDTDHEDYRYFEQLGPEEIEKYFKEKKSTEKYGVVQMTSNAITLNNDIQIVTRFCGEPDVIHENYDFLHCTNVYTEVEGLNLKMEALESIMTKELKYVGSLYPICSLFRIKKFINRGWNITAGEVLKIAWDVSKLDLNNIMVLQDQLVGVDAAYFGEVISFLKEDYKRYSEGVRNENGNNSYTIDRTYLFEIVNRVFDDIEDEREPNTSVGHSGSIRYSDNSNGILQSS